MIEYSFLFRSPNCTKKYLYKSQNFRILKSLNHSVVESISFHPTFDKKSKTVSNVKNCRWRSATLLWPVESEYQKVIKISFFQKKICVPIFREKFSFNLIIYQINNNSVAIWFSLRVVKAGTVVPDPWYWSILSHNFR